MKRLPKSIRKFLRREKARLRREFYANQELAEEKIKELVIKTVREYTKHNANDANHMRTPRIEK